ncbi:MAG: MBL fold metallo-hydrolase [Candidatus Omnitrophota bacterium]|nr:MAG: MBL fold metallo-hydrolase [Candidatus Omnitrophota bacterium]
MDVITLKNFVLGDLATNSYLLFDQNTKKAFLIDAPHPGDEIQQFIRETSLDLRFCLLTHAHFDHIGAIEKLSCPFYVHSEDTPFLKNPDLNGSSFFGSPFTVEKDPLLLEETAIDLESFHLEILHTPGHTPGSITIKIGNWLFSGDAVFFDSVGRTDLPMASHEQLINSIKKKILSLPEDTIIYPGHGPSTTVEREKRHNPFLS